MKSSANSGEFQLHACPLAQRLLIEGRAIGSISVRVKRKAVMARWSQTVVHKSPLQLHSAQSALKSVVMATKFGNASELVKTEDFFR